MASKEAREAAIKRASELVQGGSAWLRRAGDPAAVAAKEFDIAAALSDAYSALTAYDLGPDCSEAAVENAREILADAILHVQLHAREHELNLMNERTAR